MKILTQNKITIMFLAGGCHHFPCLLGVIGGVSLSGLVPIEKIGLKCEKIVGNI
jgi:hypothetical protein